MPARGSELLEPALDLGRILALGEREHQQDPRLLRVEGLGGDEAVLGVIDLGIQGGGAGRYAGGAHYPDTVLARLGQGVEQGVV